MRSDFIGFLSRIIVPVCMDSWHISLLIHIYWLLLSICGQMHLAKSQKGFALRAHPALPVDSYDFAALTLSAFFSPVHKTRKVIPYSRTSYINVYVTQKYLICYSLLKCCVLEDHKTGVGAIIWAEEKSVSIAQAASSCTHHSYACICLELVILF